MTLEQLKTMVDNTIQAIRDYRNEKDYDEIELERIIDFDLLYKLPRDLVFLEWFDRSDIKYMADGVFDDPVSEDLADLCMKEIQNFGGNIMDNEIVENIVADVVRTHKGV